MCLILIGVEAHPRFPLVIAANRDEFYDRPAAGAAFWPEQPNILAGRDLKAGGTWFAVDRQGRVAAVTNVHRATPPETDRPSRGELPIRFLRQSLNAQAFVAALRTEARAYAGFNLLLGDETGFWIYSNQDELLRRLDPGIHGLSNGLPETRWPKVSRGTALLRDCLNDARAVAPDLLLDLMTDRQVAADEALPERGVAIALERAMAPMFIVSDRYGTRCTTLYLREPGQALFIERSYRPGEAGAIDARLEYDLLPTATPG